MAKLTPEEEKAKAEAEAKAKAEADEAEAKAKADAKAEKAKSKKSGWMVAKSKRFKSVYPGGAKDNIEGGTELTEADLSFLGTKKVKNWKDRGILVPKD